MPHSWHSPSPTPWVHDTLWASKLKGMQTMINYKTKISILRRSMAHQRLKTGLGPRSGELLVQGVHREPAGWLQMRRSSPAHPQSKHQPDLPPDSHFIHTATWGQSSVVDIRLGYINIRIFLGILFQADSSFSTTFSLVRPQHNHLLLPRHHFKLLQLFSWYHHPNNDRGR
jgi:hypothetical protein